jgi:hypothetical protein
LTMPTNNSQQSNNEKDPFERLFENLMTGKVKPDNLYLRFKDGEKVLLMTKEQLLLAAQRWQQRRRGQEAIEELEGMALLAEQRAEEYLRQAPPDEAKALRGGPGVEKIVREGWIESVLSALQTGQRAWNQALRANKVKEVVLQKAEELSRLYRLYRLGGLRHAEASELAWNDVMVEDPTLWEMTPQEALEEQERLQAAEEELLALVEAWLSGQS